MEIFNDLNRKKWKEIEKSRNELNFFLGKVSEREINARLIFDGFRGERVDPNINQS